MSRNVGIGIIGCGRVAVEYHLPALCRIPGAEIVALADLDLQRAATAAEKFGIEHYLQDARELISMPQIEAVGILTSTASHFDIGMAALTADKHVFMEKPLALSRDHCDSLVRESRRRDRRAMVGYNLRWHGIVREAKRIVESGKLGTIKAISSRYTHFRDGRTAQPWHRAISTGGGVTSNESVHHFDLWRFLTGQEIIEVAGFHQASEYYEDETSIVSARLTGGVLGCMVNTFRTGPTNEMEIMGSLGRLHLNLYRFDGITFYPGNEYPGSLGGRFRQFGDTVRRAGRLPGRFFGDHGFAGTFRSAWRHFLSCVNEGCEPACSFADGRQASLAAMAAVRSFGAGRTLSVDDPGRPPDPD